MTCRTILRWLKVIDVEPVLAFSDAFRGPHVPAPFELRDQIRIPNMRRRISMAFKTPTHAECFVLIHDFHGVDATVTFDATDATVHMGGVIEVGVVGQIMRSDPLHWHSGFIAFMQWSKQLALGVNLRMTVHACLRGRNRSGCGVLDRVVTVSAVHAQLTCMQAVAERHRLRRHVPDISRLWTEPPGHHEGHIQRRCSTHHEYEWENQVGPFWEGVVVSTHMVTSGLAGAEEACDLFHKVKVNIIHLLRSPVKTILEWEQI